MRCANSEVLDKYIIDNNLEHTLNGVILWNLKN